MEDFFVFFFFSVWLTWLGNLCRASQQFGDQGKDYFSVQIRMWSGSLQAEIFSLWKGLTIILLRALTDWIRLAHIMMDNLFYSVQFSSVSQSSPTLCDPMNHSTPGLPVHHQFLEFTQTHVYRVCDAIQPSHPLLSPSPPAPIPPSIRVFSNESTLRMRWPKYWSFSFSVIPSKEHPGLISRMDWLDLLAVQGTLKSLLQHHSSKASILRCSAPFTVQLSHPYMIIGKP